MTDFQKFYRNEGDYPQLDGEGACRRLSAAIACRTVNGTAGCDGSLPSCGSWSMTPSRRYPPGP